MVDVYLNGQADRMQRDRRTVMALSGAHGIGSGKAIEEVIEAAVLLNYEHDMLDEVARRRGVCAAPRHEQEQERQSERLPRLQTLRTIVTETPETAGHEGPSVRFSAHAAHSRLRHLLRTPG
jgi:hypothetical protein